MEDYNKKDNGIKYILHSYEISHVPNVILHILHILHKCHIT